VDFPQAKEAHVFRFNADDVEKQRIKAHNPFRKIHHKAGVIGAGHVHLDHTYFDDIANALDGVQEWLLTGPAGAKDEMSSYLATLKHGLRDKLMGVETVDHPIDGQLVGHARHFFKAADRMRPKSPSPVEN
jgi:hypothetical protein